MTKAEILRAAATILMEHEMRANDERPMNDQVGRQVYELVTAVLLQAAREEMER